MGTTGSRYYQLWIAPQGDDLTGLTVYTRQRLATSDSTVSPQLLDITVAAFGQNIGVGAIIPSMDNSHAYCSAVLDDITKKSGEYFHDVLPNAQQKGDLLFKKRTTIPAPWILQPNDALVQNIQPTYVADTYSNRQVLKGVIGTGTFSNKFIGDSNKTSFNLSYKVAPGNVPSITLNGNPQSIGMKGTVGFGWYYAEGETDIAQDSSGTVLTGSDTLIVSYTGTFDTSVTFDTYRPGLIAGQVQPAFIPTRQFINVQLLISAVDIGIRSYRKPDGSLGNQYYYTVTASENANQKSWQKQLVAVTQT